MYRDRNYVRFYDHLKSIATVLAASHFHLPSTPQVGRLKEERSALSAELEAHRAETSEVISELEARLAELTRKAKSDRVVHLGQVRVMIPPRLINRVCAWTWSCRCSWHAPLHSSDW